MKLNDKWLSERIDITEGEGATRMRFMFLMANRMTQNGNIYSPQVLQAAAGEFQKRVEKYGPTFGSPGHVKDLELNDVSHMIENIEFDEKKGGLVATVKLLPNQKAKNISAIIKNGGRVGVSARGVGEKAPDGNVSKYSIQGVDFTLSPSTGIDVGENEIIFESASLNEVQTDICEQRWQSAVRLAGYGGTLDEYKRDIYSKVIETEKSIGDLHQASIDRSKELPKSGIPGFETYPGHPKDDGDLKGE